MSCAVFLSNLVERAFGANFQVYQYGTDRLISSSRLLPPGSYTITADAPEGVTCCIETTDSGGGSKAFLPASGEYTFPCTLDLSAVSWVTLHIGYAGFRSEPIGTWTDIDDSDVQNVGVTRSGSPARDIYETVMIRPDEIPDSDTISKAVCAKSTLKLTVFPHFEAWKFAKRGETLVRVIDFEDGMIFRGRVSEINDRMSAGGAQSQVLTCLSSADFLEDTGYTDDIPMEGLDAFLGDIFAAHNGSTELARRLTFTLTGSAKVSSFTDYIVQSHYKVLSDVLTGGKYLSKGTGTFVKGYKMEWRERYSNDVTHIDIAERLGTDCDTAILIGDNLKEINIDRGLDGGLYTSVMAVSGVCADGYRMAYTAYNDAMYTRYGGGRQAVVINNDIYFSGSGGREPTAGGGYNWHTTPETEAAQAALKAFAEREAAKLSDPPIKITLTAADLAKMGYTGYEPFDVYNTYPVVYPPGGLFGQRMRLTAITRRLSDGQITSMMVESGEKLADSGGSLSSQVSKIKTANNAATNDDSKLIGITDQKIVEQTDGVKTLRVTKDDYDSSSHDGDTLYIIKDGDELSMSLGDDPIMKEGGGGVIETATVLSSGQMTEWAPAHDLVPTWFRGNAAVYYGQPPAKIIIQGQRATFGGGAITKEDIMSEVAFEFRDGTRQKLEVYIHRMSLTAMRLGVKCYDISGAAEIFLGSAVSTDDFTTSGSAQVGMILLVSELYANPDLELAPQYGIMLAVKIGDQAAQTATLPSIAASNFTGRNVDFGSAAERGFASGIARKTEPSG
jgi:hypothetical protein